METASVCVCMSRCTGKERDAESGLDYFGARYYRSNMGRFMSPDWSAGPTQVPFADLSDPQSLNIYRYGANNPLRFRDLDGHTHQECGAQTSSTDPMTGALTVNANCKDVPALASETGGASLALTAYGVVGATGDLTAGTSELLGSIFGSDSDLENISNAGDAVAAVTTVSGATTLVVTGGNVDAASHAASIEDIVVTAGAAGLRAKALTWETHLDWQMTQTI